MSLKLGSTSIGSIYLGSTKIAEAYLGSTKVYGSAAPVDPYNPLGLPANTMRVKLDTGKDPSGQYWVSQYSLVDATENIWDITVSYGFSYIGSSFSSISPIEILGANTTGVTSFANMCQGCSTLTLVALFDTRSATDMSLMFYNCTSLTAVPLFDTGSVTDMGQAFYGCENVEHGALALYQQASSQSVPPANHSSTFTDCGYNTTTGRAELDQIPSDWK